MKSVFVTVTFALLCQVLWFVGAILLIEMMKDRIPLHLALDLEGLVNFAGIMMYLIGASLLAYASFQRLQTLQPSASEKA